MQIISRQDIVRSVSGKSYIFEYNRAEDCIACLGIFFRSPTRIMTLNSDVGSKLFQFILFSVKGGSDSPCSDSPCVFLLPEKRYLGEIKICNLASITKGLSQAMQKILKSRSLLSGLPSELGAVKYFIRKLYLHFKGDRPKTRWRKVICNNKAILKAQFILSMGLQGRLATKTRLACWGIQVDQYYVLCRNEAETLDHLFVA